MTKLASALPQGGNGLDTIAHKLVSKPHDKHVVVGVVDCSKVTTDHDNGSIEPTARMRRVEIIDPEDLITAEQLIRRGLDRRLGATVLPMAIEDDIHEAFGSVTDDDLEDGLEIDPDADDNEIVTLRNEVHQASEALKQLDRYKYARIRRVLQLITQQMDDKKPA